jgi:hypothetical protein
MSSTSLIFGGLLALLMGFLAQQTMETLINTCLTVLPFNVKTVK